uniref:Uncharacterized protein n=1 Tax=Sphaerodactylus townsendi TaxID=933632 RepID=A0ACB8F3F1_9SAUR
MPGTRLPLSPSKRAGFIAFCPALMRTSRSKSAAALGWEPQPLAGELVPTGAVRAGSPAAEVSTAEKEAEDRGSLAAAGAHRSWAEGN